MGTVLHERGIAIDECFDALNLSQPALVADVHRSYLAAGADAIETNSFGANRFKLAQHGLETQVFKLNQAAVVVARRVIASSFRSVLLAGSVGPLGVRLAPLGRVSAATAQAAFAEQIAGLTTDTEEAAGVDLIVLETMPALAELEAALAAAREVTPQTATLAMMTFTRDDRTLLGETPRQAAKRLISLGVDALGVNCSGGPAQVLRLLEAMAEVAGQVPLAAIPNAGWPHQHEGGRVLYPATPAYLAQYASAFVDAGARIVGGCCGTTAAHISAMRRALDNPSSRRQLPSRSERSPVAAYPAIQADRPTGLRQALDLGRFVVTVEMSPPRGIAAHKLLAGATTLKEAGAGFIDVADSPLARMRMSAWAAAHLIQQRLSIEAILHFPTRGRNLLRVQGDLLAAHSLGIRNLFIVMGDPTRIGDYPEAMDDYDIVPSGLIRLIKEGLNKGRDQAGQKIDQPTSFTVGCALNLEPVDLEREMRLLQRKIRNGADFTLTQPVFNVEAARRFIETYQQTYGELIPVVAGLQPPYNSGNAEFLHHEVPGISVPKRYRQRLRSAADPQSEGVRIAAEILTELRPWIQGVYLIPAFGRYDLVADVLDRVKAAI